MDVVYNHTAEGNHMGPTLSFKGIDNQAYYRLVEGDEANYFDTTGTGNSLNVSHPVGARAHHRLAPATGSRRCTSTASASTWRRH